LWVDGTAEDDIMDRIQGSITELIHPEETNDLIGEEFYKSFDDILKIQDCARHVLFHHCDQRCLRHTGPGDDQLKCRVPATILLNPVYTEHSWVTIELHHASGYLDFLKDLGLCHDESTSKGFIPLDYRFINERCYPCAMPGEGIMSPTNGGIFAYTLSQSNVQHTTAYFLSRYLAKYVAGIDERNVIYVAPGNDYAGGKQNIT
jgi:hypothetical protein